MSLDMGLLLSGELQTYPHTTAHRTAILDGRLF